MKKLLWFLIPFVVAFAAGYYYFVSNNKATLSPSGASSLSPSPSPSSIFENPPTQSLKGQIISKTGDVSWQSRSVTQSAKLEDLKPVLQGELFETGDDGKLSILFANVLSVVLSPKSKINFAQTLPQNLVLVQSAGTVDYKQEGTDIVSIRVLSLLIRENSAEIKVQVDEENQSLAVSVLSGSATAAYVDLSYNSHVENITEGQQLTFNDKTRKAQLR